MGKLLIVVGLPGSGKTTHLQTLKKRGEVDIYFDDYQAGVAEHDTDPRQSIHYLPLLRCLEAGQNAAVSDIIYCKQSELHRFLGAVLSVVPAVDMELHYFENSPLKCATNVKNRGRDEAHIQRELEFITTHSPTYTPMDTKILDVYAETEVHGSQNS